MDNEKLIIVGKLYQKLNIIAGTDLPNMEIYCSIGLSVHLKKSNHGNCLKYIKEIPEIIENPDYVGKNPKEPNSIELVKKFSENILVAIKLDIKENYLYVASLYDVSQTKVERRLHSDRLKKFN